MALTAPSKPNVRTTVTDTVPSPSVALIADCENASSPGRTGVIQAENSDVLPLSRVAVAVIT